MEEIKAPKKERKFLKTMGEIGLNLLKYLLLDVGKKVINKVGKKREGLVIAFVVLAFSFAYAQFPNTGNKQRLGFQTTADGLVWRGSISDTASIQPVSNQNAWVILDTVNLKIYSFDFTSNVWNQVGGSAFTQPVDSLFFDTSVPPNNVDTAKMRWDYEKGTVVLGMYDQVPNELGFKNFWLVKNQTGSLISKGSLVYASGTLGSSGRILVSKFIANGTIDAKYLLGITAHDLSNGEDGYVISFGKIRQVNTDTFAAGAILYPSPTVAGVWTDVEPVAPNLDMPIGFCINSSSNNGTIAIRVASGYKLDELHDAKISSPVDKASLFYSGGLWRDTTAALLVSDTASMLANYATKAYADTSGRFYARQDFTNVSSSTLTWTQSDTLVVGGVNVLQVYRNGQILLPTQYTIPTNASVVIGATAYKVGENYTVIFPRGGGAGSGGGSGSLTSISGGTGIIVNPNPITTTGTVSADLSVLMELTDTSLLNLNTRFASKLNAADTASLSSRIDAKGNGTVTSVATGYGLSGGTITNSGTLLLDSATVFTRIRDSIVDVAIGNDTIKILKQEYPAQSSAILNWTVTSKFPIQLKAYILVFRNGQLLNNNQYDITDTAQITIVSTSFKVGANYTIATVSGIGSVGTGTYPNPIYPEAGIALSTGTTWTTSIPNNSSNWNTAYNDRLKWDGGSTGLVAATGRTSLGGTTIGQSMFTLTNPSAITFPRFNADNTVSALSASNFRSAISAGTVTSVNVASGTPLSILNNTTIPEISMAASTSSVNGYLTSTDWTTFNNKQAALGFTPANSTITISTTAPLQGGGNLTANRTLSITQATTSANGFLTSTDWNTFNNKVNISDTASMLLPYFRDADTSLLNLTSRFNAKVNFSDTTSMLLPYLRKADTTNMLLPYFRDADTSLLNLTNRFAAKQNLLNGTGFVKASDTSITYDNSTYLTTSSAASTYLPLTGGTLTGNLVVNGSSTLKFTNIYDKTTYTPFNAGIGEQSISNVGAYLRGGTVIIFPDSNLVGSSANLFLANSNVLGVEYSAFGSGLRNYSKQGGDNRRNSLAFYTSDIGQQNTNRLYVNYNGDIGINDDTPSYKLDVNGTLGVTGAATLSSTLAVEGDITENGNNVLTSADTTSLSNRINTKVGLTGNETVAGDKTFSNKIILNDSSRFEGNVLFKKNMGLPIVKIANADYTATTANHTIIYTTLTSDKTLTIPNAADALGIKYTISIFDEPEGNEALTLQTPSNNLFVRTDGEGASVDIVGGYCTIIQSDGEKWYILSYSPMY